MNARIDSVGTTGVPCTDIAALRAARSQRTVPRPANYGTTRKQALLPVSMRTAYNQDLHPLNLRSEGASRRKAALLLMTPSSSTIRTNVYVDGFNLYYGAAKDTLYKWVNLADLCLQVMPGLTLNRIRYFTALVKPRPSNPQIRLRQEIYIRALETLPNLTVHYGHYLLSEVSMPLASPPPSGSRFAKVIKLEEKGSDVNLATYMLADAFRKDCDQLIVITNDSDLVEPVRIINKELRIPVGIFNPQTSDTAIRRSRITGQPLQPARPSIELRKVAKFNRDITSEGAQSHMALSQFPSQLIDAQGRTITKPTGW